MGLPAVMDVVLEQMQQQAIHPLALDGAAAMHGNDALQSGRAERVDDLEQTLVDRGLRLFNAATVAQGSWSAQAAGPSVPPSIAST